MKPDTPLTTRSFLRLAAGAALALGAGLAAPAWAEDHSAHAAAANGALRRSEVALQPAAVAAIRHDGQRVDFRKALDDGRPVMVNFIFTSCTAICPVTSQVFRETRERLGRDRDAVHVVSVSIDADHDTPRRMDEYAQRFSSGGAWSFFTGTRADSVAIQKSFNAYQGDKMNHVPVTFLRAAPGRPWIRLDGFASPTALVAEVRSMLAARAAAAAPRAENEPTVLAQARPRP